MHPHRYCSRCGAPLGRGRRGSGRLPPACARCGELLPFGPVPAVGVAVVESGCVLLVRRRFPPMEGTWAFPGGFLEVGESPESAARREALEETGLRVRLAGLLGTYRGGGPAGGVVFICYRGVVEGGRLSPGDDASETGFFPLARPPEPFALGPHPRVLDRLRSRS
jgi:8-oxo-dGTP diphosphatase